MPSCDKWNLRTGTSAGEKDASAFIAWAWIHNCSSITASSARLSACSCRLARYTAHLQTLLSAKAKILLVTVYFDAGGGPPFSVPTEEVVAAYTAADVTLLASADASAYIPGALERGATFVHENVRD